MTHVIIVDKNGEFVGEEEFKTDLNKGLIRLIVRIFIFNSKGELFLQKRSEQVAIYPRHWDKLNEFKEEYRSGRNGTVSKAVVRATGP